MRQDQRHVATAAGSGPPSWIGRVAFLAERLGGAALTAAHGAPVRLVAPAQYGYKSVKGLVAPEFRRRYVAGSAGLKEHRRGCVAAAERSRLLPGPVWRQVWARAPPIARRPYRD